LALLDEGIYRADELHNLNLKLRNLLTKGIIHDYIFKSYAEALQLYDEAIALARSIGDYTELLIGLGNSAATLHASGKPDQALQRESEAYEIALLIQHFEGILISEIRLAHYHLDLGELVQAKNYLRKLLKKVSNTTWIYKALYVCQRYCHHTGNTLREVELLAFLLVQDPDTSYKEEIEKELGLLKEQLELGSFDTALERGKMVSANDLIESFIFDLDK
jgi:tetratricopeptide (TPR) repeat protein